MKFCLYLVLALALAIPFAAASNYPAVAVTYTALSPMTLAVANAPGDVSCESFWIYQNTKLIRLQAGSAIFGGPGDVMSSDYYFDTVYFDPIGLTYNGTILNGNYYQDTNIYNWHPRVFWKLPERDCYNWNDISYYGATPGIGVSINGFQPGVFKPIWFTVDTTGLGKIIYVENAGAYDGNDYTPVNAYIPFRANNPAYLTHHFKEFETSVSSVYYYGLGQQSYSSRDTPFITERGTRWISVGTAQVSAQFAAQVAKPDFTFATAGSGIYHAPETLITDSVDRTPMNRRHDLPEDIYPSSLSSSDTSQITSPLRAASPVTNALYCIGGTDYGCGGAFTSFNTYTMSDPKSSFSYDEHQSFWFGTLDRNILYQHGINDVVILGFEGFPAYTAMAYSAKFAGNDFGVPVCTGDLAISGDWTSCPAGSNSRTDTHRVQIRFMESSWIISQMTPPSAQLASSTAAINGGTVKLAKERVYGIVNVGQQMDDAHFGGSFLIKLSDVTANGDAVLTIMDPLENVLGKIQVAPGKTYAFAQSGTNNSVKIHVYKTYYNMRECKTCTSWAEMATYSNEITLADNMRYNLVNGTHPDKLYKVSLLWKNKDYAGGSSSAQPDSLREAVVYQAIGLPEYNIVKGTVYNFFLNSPPVYMLTYEGITANVTPIAAMPETKFQNISNQTNVTNQTNITKEQVCYTKSVIEIDCASDSDMGIAGGEASATAVGTWIGKDGCSYKCKEAKKICNKKQPVILYEACTPGQTWWGFDGCRYECRPASENPSQIEKAKAPESQESSTGSKSSSTSSDTGSRSSGSSSESASGSSEGSRSSADSSSDVAGAMVDMWKGIYNRVMEILGSTRADSK